MCEKRNKIDGWKWAYTNFKKKSLPWYFYFLIAVTEVEGNIEIVVCWNRKTWKKVTLKLKERPRQNIIISQNLCNTFLTAQTATATKSTRLLQAWTWLERKQHCLFLSSHRSSLAATTKYKAAFDRLWHTACMQEIFLLLTIVLFSYFLNTFIFTAEFPPSLHLECLVQISSYVEKVR